MTITQPTDSTTPRNALTAAQTLVQFLTDHPELQGQPMDWRPRPDGQLQMSVRYMHVDSARLAAEIATCLDATVDKHPVGDSIGFYVRGSIGETAVSLSAYLPKDPFAEFTANHARDPLAWSEEERVEYAALSAAVQAVTAVAA
ncbi:hypothetical protein [Streptacidiphilus albus]|uniref:hypothetical protein n=1 Tax=Streptacidiphilus albus TaxID=105425 RepID=UPI00054C0E3B|nr:hypothetical protein [Streptacidiphilus albus]